MANNDGLEEWVAQKFDELAEKHQIERDKVADIIVDW